MSTIAERKAEYEKSWIKQLMDASGHQVCQRCFCCDLVPDEEPCWHCGSDDGIIDLYDEDPLWYDEDEIEFCPYCTRGPRMICVGNCDDEGNHNGKLAASASQAEQSGLSTSIFKEEA